MPKQVQADCCILSRARQDAIKSPPRPSADRLPCFADARGRARALVWNWSPALSRVSTRPAQRAPPLHRLSVIRMPSAFAMRCVVGSRRRKLVSCSVSYSLVAILGADPHAMWYGVGATTDLMGLSAGPRLALCYPFQKYRRASTRTSSCGLLPTICSLPHWQTILIRFVTATDTPAVKLYR